MPPKRATECICIETNSYSILCHGHMLKYLNVSNEQEAIKFLLKPLNFENYANKFIMLYYNRTGRDMYFRIISCDDKVKIFSRTSDDKIIMGYIDTFYDDYILPIQTYIVNDNNKAEMHSIYPYLDVIKKKLKNI